MGIDFNHWTDNAPKKIDFDSINLHAINNIVSVLEYYMPGGKIKGKEYVCGSVDGGSGNSTSTNIHTCVGKDFSDGLERAKWGDPISMVAAAQGLSMSDAAVSLSRYLGIDPYCPPEAPKPKPQVDRAIMNEKAKQESLSLWSESVPCPAVHPYLVRKQIPTSADIRMHSASGDILVPLYDEKGEFWCVQKIPAKEGGKKLFVEGSAKSGHFFLFMGKSDTVYICEGFATAASVHQATGCTVYMAVDATNISKVAKSAVKMFPLSHVVFAADNDNKGEHNTGVLASEKACAEIGKGVVIAPPCPAGQKIDWNDYVCQFGTEAANKLLLRSRPSMLIDVKSMKLTEPDFLIEDCIETPCTGMVFGPSGGGKSFMVLDMMFHVSTGKPWNGHKVKEGVVIYIVGEGRHAIPRRLEAWQTYHGIEIPENKFLISNLRIEFDHESVTALGQEIEYLASSVGAPVMIVIDTLARALPGNMEENSNKDVGMFINECDRLQALFNCAVLIVHHTGHNEQAKNRARGASALKGAMDVEIFVDNERNLLEWTKTKDIEPHHPIAYSLKKFAYGQGRYDNSCVVEYNMNVDLKENNLARSEDIGLLALKNACEAMQMPSVTVDTWKDQFIIEYGGSSEAASKQFRRVKDKLIKNKMVDSDGKTASIPKKSYQNDIITEAMFGDLVR